MDNVWVYATRSEEIQDESSRDDNPPCERREGKKNRKKSVRISQWDDGALARFTTREFTQDKREMGVISAVILPQRGTLLYENPSAYLHADDLVPSRVIGREKRGEMGEKTEA
jgi:hypothetical protein